MCYNKELIGSSYRQTDIGGDIFLEISTKLTLSCLLQQTNHLDLESVEWLEEFLRQQNIPMVIVSHDREFLDQVCTKIVDAEGGICQEYDGNYSRFLQLKKGEPSLTPRSLYVHA